MIKKKIKNEEVASLSNATIYDFPKYTTMIVNLVNGTAQATRPKVVGQMSELIQEFDGQTLEEWVEWYTAKKPNAIKDATAKISNLMIEIRKAMELILKNHLHLHTVDFLISFFRNTLRIRKNFGKERQRNSQFVQ